MNTKIKYTIKLFTFIFLSVIYLELLFKVRLFDRLQFDIYFLKMTLFALSYSFMLMFFILFFKKKAAFIMVTVLTVIITFSFINQEIYSSILHQFYSFAFAGDITKGLSFINKYFGAMSFTMLAYFLPLVLLLIFRKTGLLSFDIEYSTTKQPLIFVLLIIITYFISLQTIDERVDGVESDILYSDMDLYTFMYNPQKALKRFGLLTYTQRDFFSLFRLDPLTDEDHNTLLEEYLDDKYANNEHDDYYPYSDIFSEKFYNKKNFILIMAESLDTYAINEDITPTLYEFKETSAYFDNYYSPLYYRSTADTEFLTQTSMYPDKNVTLSMSEYLDNNFTNTFPKLFEAKGYDTFSFHNYTDYFYPRTEFHKTTLGYDYYWGATDLGMLPEPEGIINNHLWQSDLEMFEMSMNAPITNENGIVEYISFLDSDNFFVNYITVSGHFNYSKNHEIAATHEEELEQYYTDNPEIERPDDSVFYYLAANMDLDLGLKYLKEQLVESGKWDETVILIFGDHYAYGIDESIIWEYDTVKSPDLTNLEMEIHNVPMMICTGTGETIEEASCGGSSSLSGRIPNYISSIDILPTVANLFDLDLDYRTVFGNDALASENNYVRFSDMSFISRFVSYDSLSEEYTYSEDFLLPGGYSIVEFYNNDELLLPDGFVSKEDYVEDYMEAYLLLQNALMVKDYQYNVTYLNLDYLKPKED